MKYWIVWSVSLISFEAEKIILLYCWQKICLQHVYPSILPMKHCLLCSRTRQLYQENHPSFAFAQEIRKHSEDVCGNCACVNTFHMSLILRFWRGALCYSFVLCLKSMTAGEGMQIDCVSFTARLSWWPWFYLLQKKTPGTILTSNISGCVCVLGGVWGRGVGVGLRLQWMSPSLLSQSSSFNPSLSRGLGDSLAMMPVKWDQ